MTTTNSAQCDANHKQCDFSHSSAQCDVKWCTKWYQQVRKLMSSTTSAQCHDNHSALCDVNYSSAHCSVNQYILLCQPEHNVM